MARPRSDIAQRIVSAAAERFLHDGVDGASLRRIAQAAGTNLGMVYYYFPSKDDLFLAVVERHYAPLSQALIAAGAALIDAVGADDGPPPAGIARPPGPPRLPSSTPRSGKAARLGVAAAATGGGASAGAALGVAAALARAGARASFGGSSSSFGASTGLGGSGAAFFDSVMEMATTSRFTSARSETTDAASTPCTARLTP